jgi:hypothetical protein
MISLTAFDFRSAVMRSRALAVERKAGADASLFGVAFAELCFFSCLCGEAFRVEDRAVGALDDDCGWRRRVRCAQ